MSDEPVPDRAEGDALVPDRPEGEEPVSGRPEGDRGAGRRLISSGGPFEVIAGYSRAVVVGDSCWVAGTTDLGPDGVSRHPGDVTGQARATLGIIEAALAEAGFSLADVVRTRMFLTDIQMAPAVVAVHGEVFGAIRPASTLVGVNALIHPSLLIEIEADARRAG